MPHELDSDDLDAVRELRGKRGYTLVFIRQSDEIKRLVEELIKPAGQIDRSEFIRGQIAGLRTALEIPQILEDEARVNAEIAPLKRYIEKENRGR